MGCGGIGATEIGRVPFGGDRGGVGTLSLRGSMGVGERGGV